MVVGGPARFSLASKGKIAMHEIAIDPAALRASTRVGSQELARSRIAYDFYLLVGRARVVGIARLYDAGVPRVGEAVVALDRIAEHGALLRPFARAHHLKRSVLAEKFLCVIRAARVILIERLLARVALLGEVVVARR
jgi:hypothetical protein